MLLRGINLFWSNLNSEYTSPFQLFFKIIHLQEGKWIINNIQLSMHKKEQQLWTEFVTDADLPGVLSDRLRQGKGILTKSSSF